MIPLLLTARETILAVNIVLQFFYHNDTQKNTAEKVIKEINDAHIWDAPIVTEIKPYTKFHSAEDYHRDYFELHPQQTYCQLVIAPKVAKFRKKWENKLKNR